MAADIGGTFTDIAVQTPDGELMTRKLPSTPTSYADAVATGIREVLGMLSIASHEISDILHACTVATNAILEGKGAQTALVTTAGFRDVLELRRIRVPRLYEPLYVKPHPLVPRRLRFEVRERIDAHGDVIEPLQRNDLENVVERLRAERVEAVAVCFLHSYCNDKHECLVAETLRQKLPDVYVSTSAEVLPEAGEYERTSTTVINAYVGPPVRRYLETLKRGLAEIGITAPLQIMQSSGGIVDIGTVIERPAQIVECGPAAGVIGAGFIGEIAGYDNLITFDMGGTTAKAAVIERGTPSLTDEYEVGGGISFNSQLGKGGGYALKLPAIDISEVGAGGGSIVRLDKAGSIKIGPDSAGAEPGPACYSRGNDEPTVTDANVVLGFLGQRSLAGGSVPIDASRSWQAVERRVATPLGLEVAVCANGIHSLANMNMMRAIKSVTTNRGRDPRKYSMFAFGGNGGIHAVELARALRIERVIVPHAAGVFSAAGLLFADTELSLTQALGTGLHDVTRPEVERTFSDVEHRLAEMINRPFESLRFQRFLDVRYAGQAHELSVSVPSGPLNAAAARTIQEQFESEHERAYGHKLQGNYGFEYVRLRVSALHPKTGNDSRTVSFPIVDPLANPAPGSRPVYFGTEFGWQSTPVLRRPNLAGQRTPGPLIVEEYEGTIVVPPNATAQLDNYGSVIIDVGC